MSRFSKWLLAAVFGLGLLFAAAPAYAAPATTGIFNDACNGQTNSATCTSVTPPKGTNPLTGSNGILMKVARIIAIIGGVTAVIVIIISGFSYMTANGDAQKAKKARDALVGALVGLFIISIASIIITFVVNNSGV